MGQKSEFWNTPEETKIIKTIERTRIAVCFVGIFLGHLEYYHTFAALTVFSLAGITALETFYFGDASARAKGWLVRSQYQAQSACNNAALALVTLVILLGSSASTVRGRHVAGHLPKTERSDAALATTTAVTLLFMLLSGINHLSHAKDASIHKKRFYGALSLALSGGWVLCKWGAF
jgi:hypothetical protein